MNNRLFNKFCFCITLTLSSILSKTFRHFLFFFYLGPKWYPFVGSSPILRKEIKKLGSQHKVFEKWMDDYKSPLIGLKLGNEYVVVALTYEMVSSIHTNELYDGRPDNFFIRLRTMGSRYLKNNYFLFYCKNNAL